MSPRRPSSTSVSDEIRKALADPGFYPGPPSEVIVRESHISWVFLAGDRAYKLKKPVTMPFLDYGTPERRRRMCQEEVRLNRVLAGEVYLGVRGVAKAADGYELIAEDDPRALDYLVEMRRFDERETLASRLRRGEVGPAEIAAVAARLAGFHERARHVRLAGVPSLALERRLEENLHELLGMVEQRSEMARVFALQRLMRAFLLAHASMLDSRAFRGLTREVHGDVRAAHVLLEEHVQILDCVEFDRGLRELDVGEDLAFLVMDLAAHGGERFAQTLLEEYRRAGGDPGDDRLVAFYALSRALVRAKVELAQAAQQDPRSAAHGHHSAAARELLALAERFAWRARLPLAIVICGMPAAGKSELAKVLAASCGLAHLSSDVTRKQLAGIAPSQRGGEEIYSSGFSALTYAKLGARAAAQVRADGGVLVDATFRRRAEREAFAEAFADAAPLLYVECAAPASVLERRARTREAQPDTISDATVEVVRAEADRWEPLDEVDGEAHLTLRTDRSIEAVLDDLVALLDRRMALSRDADGGGAANP
jgi:aminoglycoside phosphotransferase family enzyme/predicted kinase